jgi:hypothetical protein
MTSHKEVLSFAVAAHFAVLLTALQQYWLKTPRPLLRFMQMNSVLETNSYTLRILKDSALTRL